MPYGTTLPEGGNTDKHTADGALAPALRKERNNTMTAAEIKAKVEKLVKKITGSKNLLAGFKSDPLGTVKKLLGKGVPADATEKITEAVKARIGFEDVKDDAEGVISKITGLFGKK